MPFCTQCGHQAASTDVFCANCGARQAETQPPPGGGIAGDPLSRVSPRTASMLCYIPLAGWIASIIVLATPKFQHQREVRFHAFQGLYLFVAWLMLDWVLIPFIDMTHGLGPMRAVVSLLHLAIFIAWIWMLIKTSQQQMFHLPVIGELAERSVAEQGP